MGLECHSRPRRAALAPRGFSLLELVVVLTLLAVLTSGVVPVFRGSLKTMRAEHAIRDFVATLKFAQERAITDVAEYRVYIEPEEGLYWLAMYTGYDEYGDMVFESIGESLTDSQRLPENMEFDDVEAEWDREREAHFVAFYPSGACDYVEIVIRRDDDTTLEIETQGSLGRFVVEEGR